MNLLATLHQLGRCFAVYSQMNLKWKLQDIWDQRSEVPDFGLGNFTLPATIPNFKLYCSIEAKCAIERMTSLLSANAIKSDSDVESMFHSLFFQAQNQVKAVYKNGYPLSSNGVQWILLVGPYWMPKKFSPFSEAESTVHAHKVSGSSDFRSCQPTSGPAFMITELYLLISKNLIIGWNKSSPQLTISHNHSSKPWLPGRSLHPSSIKRLERNLVEFVCVRPFAWLR